MSAPAPRKPLNLGYILTKPGIFKALSVVFGLITFVLIGLAYKEGRYYVDCTAEQQKAYADLKAIVDNGGTLGYGIADTCEATVKRRGTFHFCKHFVKVLRELNLTTKAKESIRQINDLAAEALNEIPYSCPPRWLVIVPIYITGVVSGVTLVLLILQLLVDLSRKNGVFLIVIDFIVHSLIAGAFLVSTCFLTAFLKSMLTGKFSCTQRLYDLGLGTLTGFGPLHKDKHLTVFYVLTFGTNPPPSHLDVPVDLKGPTFETCLKETEFIYKLSYLIAGTIFSVVAAVFNIITVVMIVTFNKTGPAPQTQASDTELSQDAPIDNDSLLEPVDSDSDLRQELSILSLTE